MFIMKNTIKFLFTMAMLFGFSINAAYAGSGWYLTLVNGTESPLKVEGSGNHCWYTNQIAKGIVIEAHGSHRLYSEVKNSGPCYEATQPVQGVKLLVNGQQVLNSVQKVYNGISSVSAQDGYWVRGKSISCYASDNTVNYTFVVTTSGNNYYGQVTEMTCIK